MNYLLTGCAGFIGSHMTDLLLSEGNNVVGLDRLDNILYPSKIKRERLKPLIGRKNFKFIQGDINEIFKVKNLPKIDVIINEAGLPGQQLSWAKVGEYNRCNVEGAYTLGRFAIENNIGKFIQASTSSVYGEFATGDESTPFAPTSPYGTSKLSAEFLLSSMFKDSTTQLIILRYFSVFGSRQRPDMGIYKFIHNIISGKELQIYGNGEQSRSFTHVSDVAKATYLATRNGRSGDIFNVAGDENINILDLVEIIEKLSGKKANIRFLPTPIGDQKQTSGETRLIKERLKWTPETSLTEGLMEQINWYLGKFIQP